MYNNCRTNDWDGVENRMKSRDSYEQSMRQLAYAYIGIAILIIIQLITQG